eukprot:tig00000128_g7204.t1
MAARVCKAFIRDMKNYPEIIPLLVPVTIACSLSVYVTFAKLLATGSNDVALRKEKMQGDIFVTSQQWEHVSPLKAFTGYSGRFLGWMSAIPEEFHAEPMKKLRAEAKLKFDAEHARIAAEQAAWEKNHPQQ